MIASKTVLQLSVSSLLAISLGLACGGGGGDDSDGMGGAAGEQGSGGSSETGGQPGSGGQGSGGDASGGTGVGGSAGEVTAGGAAGESSGGGGEAGSTGETGGTGGEPPEESEATPCASDRDCAELSMVCSGARNVCVECASTNDCGESEVCRRGSCESADPCRTSLDCSSTDLVCVGGGGMQGGGSRGVCLECGGDNDCSDTESCVSGECVPACTSDKDCTPLGLLCDRDTLTCVECFGALDCEDAEYCAGGVCMEDVCTPGRMICLGDDLGQCDEEGAGYEQVDSCFGGSCVEAEGSASCVD